MSPDFSWKKREYFVKNLLMKKEFIKVFFIDEKKG